jgi:hypothetical protein
LALLSFNEIGTFPAYFIITFIAIIPGFMNAFVVIALLLDRRTKILADLHYPAVKLFTANHHFYKKLTYEDTYKHPLGRPPV